MGIDVTSLAIAVTTTGITEAAKALDGLVTSAKDAEKAFPGLKVAAEALSASQKSSVDSINQLIAKLEKQVNLLGANQTSINAYTAAMKGANQAQIENVMGLGAQVDAYQRLAKDQAEAIKMNKALADSQDKLRVFTAGSTREFLVMFHELSTDNIKRFAGSIIVLGERINFLPSLLKTVSAAAEAMGVSLTMAWGAIGLVIAAIATAGYAFYSFIKNASELRTFNKELILTGNYAGTTGDALYDMAVKVGKASGSISDAKDAVGELTKSGKFSVEQIEKITAAAVGLQVYGGVAVKDTVKDFITLSGDPLTGTERSFQRVTKAVLQLNESKHFLSAEVLKEISEAERAGDVHKAEAIAQEALIASDAKRIEALKANMSGFQTLTHNVGAWFSDMWEKVTGAETADATIARLKAALAVPVSTDFAGNTYIVEQRRKMQAQLDALEGTQKAKRDAATKQRQDDIKNSAALQGQIVIEAAQKLVKAEETVGERVERLRKAYADQRLAGIKISQDDEDKLVEAFRIKISAKAKKEPSDGLSEVNATVAKLEEQSNAIKVGYDNQLKLLEALHKDQRIDDDVYAYAKAETLQHQLDNTQSFYDKEINVYKDFHGKTDKENNEAASALDRLNKRKEKLLADYRFAIQLTTLAEADAYQNAIQLEQDKSDKIVKSVTDQTQKIQFQIDAYNSLPDAVRKAGISQKQMADAVTGAEIAGLQQQADALQSNDLLEIAMNARRLKEIEDQIAAKKKLQSAEAIREGQELVNSEAQKATAAVETAWKDADKRIADGLYSAISKSGGDAFKKLLSDVKNWFARLVLNPIIAPIASFGASLLNPTAASAQGSSFSTAANALSVGSAVSNLGGAVSGAGSFLGSTAISQFGAGMSMSPMTAAAMQSGALGVELTGAASAGASFAAAISTAIPWVAAAGAAYKVWDHFFGDSGPISNTRLNFTSNNAPGNISINERGNEGQNSNPYINNYGTSSFGTFGVSSSFWMNAGQKPVQDFITNVSKTDDVLAQFLTTAEKLSVTANVTGKTFTANTGSETADPNGNGQLDDIFGKRLATILEGVEPGLSSLITGFKGTTQELATEAAGLLQYRMALKDSGEAVFGVQVTLQELAALKLPTENTSAALTRITNVFNATNAALIIMGKTSEEAFHNIGLASLDMRQNLITAAGGADKLVTATSYFTQNILSDEERLKPVLDGLHKSLTDLGLSADTNIDQYKALVKAQDLSTDAGQKMFISLLDLAPAFKAVADSTSKAADASEEFAKAVAAVTANVDFLKKWATDDFNALSKAIDTQKKEAQAEYDAKAAIIDAQKKAAQTAFDTTKKMLEDQKNAAKTSYDAFVSSTNAVVDAAKTANSALGDLVSALDSALNTALDNSGLALTRAEGQAQLAQALDKAKSGGGLPTAESIASALKAVSKPDETKYASLLAYTRDTRITANTLNALDSLARVSKTNSDLQLEALQNSLVVAKDSYDAQIKSYDDQAVIAQNQLDALNLGFAAQLDAAKVQLDATNAKYDAMLAQAQEQLDVMNGTQVATLSVVQALNNFAASVSGAISAVKAASVPAISGQTPAPYSKTASADQVTKLFEMILGREPKASGLSYYTTNGESPSEVANSLLQSPEYASLHSLPSFAIGADSLPHDMVARVHKGEAIIPAADNREIKARLKSASDNEDLIAAIARLEDTVAKQQAALDRIDKSSRKTADTLVRVSQDGLGILISSDSEIPVTVLI